MKRYAMGVGNVIAVSSFSCNCKCNPQNFSFLCRPRFSFYSDRICNQYFQLFLNILFSTRKFMNGLLLFIVTWILRRFSHQCEKYFRRYLSEVHANKRAMLRFIHFLSVYILYGSVYHLARGIKTILVPMIHTIRQELLLHMFPFYLYISNLLAFPNWVSWY